MEGLQLSFPQDRKLMLGVQVLAAGAAAVGLTADALVLDERTRKHFPEGAKPAPETTT
jgi:isopentenyl diphosphate isomerase/L-lactate dehydrogenase-like FMN-dependent dehydrogenase